MALSERSRSQIYRGLEPLVGEEALGEMLSFFPARDVEEPVTKEFLRAEMADLRANLLAEIRAESAGLRSEFGTESADLRSEMSRLSRDMAEIRGELKGIKHLMAANVGLLVTFAAFIVAAVRL